MVIIAYFKRVLLKENINNTKNKMG